MPEYKKHLALKMKQYYSLVLFKCLVNVLIFVCLAAMEPRGTKEVLGDLDDDGLKCTENCINCDDKVDKLYEN